MIKSSSSPETYWRRNLVVCLFGSFTTALAMTLVLPFLPSYIELLGIQGHRAIMQWSGVAYSATFFAAGLVAPLWGSLGDRYGRKPMLIRASLGMAVTISLMGATTHLWQFIGLRILAGLAGGYTSGSTILVAVQTPRSRSAWALGTLSSGVMAGNLLGPLVGGSLPAVIGLRATFVGAGLLIACAGLASVFWIREIHPGQPRTQEHDLHGWAGIPRKGLILTLLLTGTLLMVANMSIEPILTFYVARLVGDPQHVTFTSGLVMSATALGSILSANLTGKMADRVGPPKVIFLALMVCGLLLIPQALVKTWTQLLVLRFLMGVALGGLLPCVAATLRRHTPMHCVGTVMGSAVACQFMGQVIGPLSGGFLAGRLGMPAVFLGTSLLMLLGAAAVRLFVVQAERF